MKAIVQERFGPPDILQLVDADRPEVGADQVLVRVHAAALNPYDWHMMRGDPYAARLMGAVGLTRPKSRVAGIDAAGQVEAVGADVRGLKPGDEVLGFCPGAFAEYARTTADLLVPKPATLTFEQAAAVPMGAVTALRGIRTWARCRPGSGCWSTGPPVGSARFAVQIAAALDAEVTGVCSTRNVELVRSLGAAHVIDYTREDFTDGRRALRRDPGQRGQPPAEPAAPGAHPDRDPGGQRRRLARPRVRSDGLHAATDRGQRVRPAAAPRAPPVGPGRATHEHLLAVTALVEAGKLTPVVDRTYPLTDAAAGVRHVEQGHARGKAVVTVP